MTSYFNAWLDYQSLYGLAKQYVSGFKPRVNMDAQSCDFFFGTWPDGRFISTVRVPGGWYASSSKHSKSYRDVLDRESAAVRERTRAENCRPRVGKFDKPRRIPIAVARKYMTGKNKIPKALILHVLRVAATLRVRCGSYQ